MSTPGQRELDWQAFCYAAGDLAPAEARDFENRLAESQEAREALARAVELGESLAHLPPGDWQAGVVEGRRRQAGLWVRLAWACAGAAACLALVLAGRGVLGERSTLPAAPGGSEAGAEQARTESSASEMRLAQVWSQGLSGETSDSSFGAAFDPPYEGEALPARPDSHDLALVEVPTWMLAALSGAESDMPEGDQGEPETEL